jgi:hypothetical protein
MTDERRTKTECACNGLPSGWTRVYEMPTASTDTLVIDTNFNYPWESIQKCSVCGQYWHQDTTSGHANIETLEKISVRQRAELLKKHQK